MGDLVKVGIADFDIAVAPQKIRTSGLGSCVGVTLYDPEIRVCGLAHVMLPSSLIAREEESKGKFANTAIPSLIEKMVQQGVKVRRIEAKLAGGAEMFKTTSEQMRIGARNVEACKALLNKLNIPIVAEDTGGRCGRTIELDSETGILTIRIVNQEVKEV
ncbi:chemotaxis protein CheD [Caldalkalibacillus salinus]|uniref:chemotaxis protein CheD n=1 Tax=Caldalkalibacillus salinus TaxID=2803787 RepID=UPI0019239147|nr:chemotaxis protein CheD [Caldalkalibacillus salinus]